MSKMIHVVSITELRHFADILLPNILTTEVAVQFVAITANGSFCVKYYNLEFLYARNGTAANSKWSWLFENHQPLLLGLRQEY
jgi:hypothetical protein